jgi:dTDP-4-amino-4,6-dideoxygalactose transaminase
VSRVYLSPPQLAGDEEELIREALASNWIAPLGPQVEAFEAEFADVVGVAHTVALSSGTAGLHLAMRALGVAEGDQVICSSLTFSASANPILYERARPVFIDCDETWTIDPNLVEDAVKSARRQGTRPRAVIAVDLYGQCADYDGLRAVCDRYEVPLVEDAAEALGSRYRGRPAGGFGTVGVFSFNGNKIITTSGGGMFVSGDKSLVDKARFMATQARDPAPHYQHSEIGFNYRLSNILAAVGRAQLRTLDERVATRRQIFARYQQALRDLPGVAFMPEAPHGTGNRWLTCLTIDAKEFGATREEVRLALESNDIEARPVWKPMHLQPVFRAAPMYRGDISERLFEQGLCLPSGSNLTRLDQDRVISICQDMCRAAAGGH